jgi:hypothetical protein
MRLDAAARGDFIEEEEIGCTFKHADGHDKVYLGSRMTVLPRHGTDIGPYLFNKILRDLGIKKEK